MKPEVHNPDNLTPEEYGASDGWRLLYKDEDKPGDAQVYTTSRRWRHAYCTLPVVQEKTYRTRTPDPYAEPVKPNASSWTKMSERKPTEADLPVVFWNIAEQKAKYCAKDYGLSSQSLAAHSHWMRAPFVPPPRELTQAEKDQQAFHAWDDSSGGTSVCDGWIAGIAYERAEIAKLVEQYFYNDGTDIECLRAIRARVEGAHD